MTGPVQLERPAERLEQRVQVVAGHDADVGDAEVLEQLAGLGEVDDRLAQPARQLEERSGRRPGSARPSRS